MNTNTITAFEHLTNYHPNTHSMALNSKTISKGIRTADIFEPRIKPNNDQYTHSINNIEDILIFKALIPKYSFDLAGVLP